MSGFMLSEVFTNYDDYKESGVKYCIPMTAKEIEGSDNQEAYLNDEDYYIEEKFDGTRGLLHFYDSHKQYQEYPSSLNEQLTHEYPEGFTRCFSRRVSKGTDWFVENTDSLPQLKGFNFPELHGTVIDGELFIPNRPFKDVSSALNCKSDKAISRQEELGYIVFHAFDILYYKGIKVEKMPLHRRKEFLERVVNTVNSPYLELVPYFSCGGFNCKLPQNRLNCLKTMFTHNTNLEYVYPVSALEVKGGFTSLSPKAYYESIVATGGEGVIIKPKDGKYFYKRGKEYLKIKKFLTREVIIMGFTEPTKEYQGKFPSFEVWNYWEHTPTGDLYDTSTKKGLVFVSEHTKDCVPVSKFYFEGWVGNIRYGVIISDTEIEKLPKNKKFNIEDMTIEGIQCKVIEVGDCSGFPESVRRFLSNSPEMVGTTIEVKANELFRDTGKLRHPRFLRFREDKSPISCTWSEHIGV